MSLLSVDLVWRRHEYRIKESSRDAGAQVRLTEQITGCFSCPRIMPIGTKHFTLMARCLPCAIRAGQIVHMPRCQEQDDIDAALNARADAELEASR